MIMQRDLFYMLKPVIPRSLQLIFRRAVIKHKRKRFGHVWPINPKTSGQPAEWPGWPEGKQFAIVLAHDVDTQKGHDNCQRLADIDKSLGFRSAFYFVPERYRNSQSLHDKLRNDGFQIGVHGLKHDGKLFRSYKIFKERAKSINQYLAEWHAEGFSSPSMHHNLNWMHLLNITHSTSTFDTDPFEPQPDAAGTIFPYWVNNNFNGRGYVELPYTLPQDFTLFVLMGEGSNAIWRRKIDWIASIGGMALVNTHSDYMNFENKISGNEEYPVDYYIDFLKYVRKRYAGCYYHALPSDVAIWARTFLKRQAVSVSPVSKELN